MANVLNRTTGAAYPYRKDLRLSVNTPDYDSADWIINPDLSAVQAFDSIYWSISGDTVSVVDAATRAARDTEIANQQQIEKRSDAAAEPDDPAVSGVQLRAIVELFNKRDNYLVNRIEEIQQALTNIRDQVLGSQARQNVPSNFPMATNTRTRAQAIQAYKDDINAGVAD